MAGVNLQTLRYYERRGLLIASNEQSLWIGDEGLLCAAQNAYEQRTGDPDAFCDAANAAEVDTARPTGSPADDRWDLRDEEEWRRRLPRLAVRYEATLHISMINEWLPR